MRFHRLILVCAVSSLLALGCAGIKQTGGVGSGAGGQGGSPFGLGGNGLIGQISMIPGLTALTVAPKETTLTLTGSGTSLTGAVKLTATGVVNGASMDVSARVLWTSNLAGAAVTAGNVTITAPGVYTITAANGDYQDTATVTASYTGDVVGDGVPGTAKSNLDGAPGGTAATLAYPLDRTLFPANLTPLYAHIGGAGTGATVARLRFEADGLALNYYGKCETGLPGAGCYVKLPLALTYLFIATSEHQDIKLTARVSNGSAAPRETQTVAVAWAGLPLSGGLYYWSVISDPPKVTSEGAPPTPGKYILLDPAQTGGTAIFRYDFAAGAPAPEIIWTDDGGPKSDPAYNGAPQAFNNGAGKGHCIGCHAISNDGKYMALTIGGSAVDAANLALLDIAKQQLVAINPTASTDPNSTATNNPTDYWKKFRVEGLAAENAWGPNGDVMVSMLQSKLYLTRVGVTAATGTTTRAGAVISKWPEYASDPFWSFDGSLFVFTSFDMPSKGMYNDAGLNGDMKRRGKIGIATADATGVHDDARELVPRAANVTSYYPAVSSDSKLVVFNRSTCGTATPDVDVNRSTKDTVYGNQTCDGYDDNSATLWVIDPAPGSSPVALDRANGGNANDNSWPRFSPDKGTFRGKDLYWVAFSSRRAYGLQVNANAAADPAATKPQLWVAGVLGGAPAGGSDPSFAPGWLPEQNLKPAAPNGNHVPQWVKVAIVIE